MTDAPKFEDVFDIHDHDEFEGGYGEELCVVLGIVRSGSYGTQARVLEQGTGKECKAAAYILSETENDKYSHILVMPISDLARFSTKKLQ